MAKKRFVNKEGLERFKENLETELTREAPVVPQGKKLVNVRQEKGLVVPQFAEDDTAKQSEVDEIKQHLAESGLSHNTEESTYVDDNGQVVDLPERTIMLKGFTNKPVVQHQTHVRTGRFFIISE